VSFVDRGRRRTLLDLLHEIEAAFGRRRTARWEARKMDLDLIALGDHVLPDEANFRHWHDLSPQEAATLTPDSLILPHPRMSERGFVLARWRRSPPTGGTRAWADRARDAGGVAPGRAARDGAARSASGDAGSYT
jgi:2-amino-4-hydroxy-6-hydroxymethyldihydropteridine diphosphokinase